MFGPLSLQDPHDVSPTLHPLMTPAKMDITVAIDKVLHKEGGAGSGSRLRGEERESEASSSDTGSRLETGREGTEFESSGSDSNPRLI